MKYIFKEYKSDYDNYKFPYLVYLQANQEDSIEEIYEKGFLATRIKKNYYYLARNMRVDLKLFSLSSENRRILRKTEGLSLESKSLKEFPFDYNISKLAAEYFQKKFSKKIISTQSLKKLFTEEFFTNILIYKLNRKEIGYCITMETENLLHYAYPFYKSEFIGSNIGMGMMIKAIEHAKENSKKHVYLGTVYTPDSLYKTQFKGVEWFNEGEWDDNIENLKEKIK
jgi:arginyl-tRNA--protein-N-Asp/Glu arginylyltransferase